MPKREDTLRYIFAKLAEAPTLAKEKIREDGWVLPYRRLYSRIRKHVDNFLLGERSGNVENRIIILPGLRGVGKTTLVLQIYEYLTKVKHIDQSRVLYFSADELKEYLGVKISDVIKVFIEDILKSSLVALDREVFIIIDEAHFDKDWSIAAKVVYDQTKKVFLLLTGSSALSMEMSVDLVRRAKKEALFPLNFSEYLILKYNAFPPRSTAESIRELVFNPSKNTLNSAKNKWDELKRKLLSIGKPLERGFELFLLSGGFPFGIKLDEKNIYERIFSMIERVIEKDVFSLRSFRTETRSTISRIITFLALQQPGGTSDVKLAERLKTSPTMIRNILDVLEKTHLILSVKPYGSAGKIVRKPWKYYFLSPSINTAIRFKLGAYDTKDRNIFGVLAENLVASTFFRMKETVNMPVGVFYDSDKEGVDFLIQKVTGEIVPIEVTIGKKGGSQIKKAIKKYKFKYGIIISNTPEVSMKNNTIYMPITFFSFV